VGRTPIGSGEPGIVDLEKIDVEVVTLTWVDEGSSIWDYRLLNIEWARRVNNEDARECADMENIENGV
jgi:hypothetical protein